ncbi:MAG: HAD family hydrolase [Tepidiformaceae bacterium]
MIEAVLFDLDDTLGDWATAVENAVGVAVAGLPKEDAKRLREALREFVCVRRDGRVVDRHHWRLFQPEMEWAALFGEPAIAETFQSAFSAAQMPVAYVDASVLAEISREYRVALLTNNPYGRSALIEYGLLRHFEAVVMMDEPFHKPHARAFEAACDALALAPDRIAMVGDSLANDIEGAAMAGMLPIWIDRFHDHYPLDSGALRIEQLWELPALLRSL